MISRSSVHKTEDAAVHNASVTNHTSLNTYFSKRSLVMRATHVMRTGAMMLLTLGLVAMSATAQNLKNGGTLINTGSATWTKILNYVGTGGTIRNRGTLTTTDSLSNSNGSSNGTINNYHGTAGTIVVGTHLANGAGSFDNDSANTYASLAVAGDLTNSGTFDTDAGKVEYNGSGAQSVVTTTYGALVLSGSNTKSTGADITVNDSLRIQGATFDISGDTLTLLGATNTNNGGTATFSAGRVNYAANADQTVIGTTYLQLYLSGSSAAHNKVSPSGISFAASGLLNVGANDTLEVDAGTLDLATNSPTFTNSQAVKLDGTSTATFHSGITDAGTFYYAGTGDQSIGAVTYTDLLLKDDGVKSFPSGDTVRVKGNYSIVGSGSGSRDYDSTNASSALAFVGDGGSQTLSSLDGEHMNIVLFDGTSTKDIGGTLIEARRMSLLGSGLVTNNATTLRLASISSLSLSVASGASFTNSASKTLMMNGDLENDGAITNAGTISVY